MRKVRQLLVAGMTWFAIVAWTLVSIHQQNHPLLDAGPLVWVGIAVLLACGGVLWAAEAVQQQRPGKVVVALSGTAWLVLGSLLGAGVLAPLPDGILEGACLALLPIALIGFLLDWLARRAKRREDAAKRRTAPQAFE